MKQSVLIGLIVMVAVGALIALGLYLQTSSETLKVPLPLTITHERISYDVDARSKVSAVTQNDFARHRFTVKQSGELVDLLTQKIYPHVAVVSDDLKDVTFYHVDKLSTPEDGIYEFDHLFTAPSDYSLWFELNDNTTEDHHGEKSNYIAKVLVVNSNQSADEVIQTETRGIAIDRNYRLQLNQTSFTAGTPSTLRIEIADTGNEPLSIYKDYEQHFF